MKARVIRVIDHSKLSSINRQHSYWKQLIEDKGVIIICTHNYSNYKEHNMKTKLRKFSDRNLPSERQHAYTYLK